MSKPETEIKIKMKKRKDQIIRYRCERPLILNFDQIAAQENKTRSEVLRELMAGWIESKAA